MELSVSGVLQGLLLDNVGALHTKTNNLVAPLSAAKRHGRFAIAADATAQHPSLLATNDALIDVEPTTIALNIGGITHTTSVATKYVGGDYNLPLNYFTHTTDFATYNRGPIPQPVGYTLSGDPVLAVNPYTGGIAPQRMYCAALLVNAAGANANSAIGVWWSDNGGQTWQGPTIVAAHGGGGYVLDKPWIVVSWHAGSLGNVYVGWMNIDTSAVRNPNQTSNSLWVSRSLDGGLTFQDTNVLAYDNVTGPQLVVNTSTGALTCIWFNEGVNDLRAANSTDLGVSFGAHEIVASGGNLLTPSNWWINSGLRAPSLPMARYDWIASRIIVAWHGTNDPNGLDVFYSFKPCTSSCTAYGWHQPIPIHSNSAQDQFMPGIDFDSSGRVLITYYDGRLDANNLTYHQFFSFLTADGTRIHDDVQMSDNASNPANLPAFGSPTHHFIGDYHEVWDAAYPEGDLATSGWISVISNYTDLFHTRIAF